MNLPRRALGIVVFATMAACTPQPRTRARDGAADGGATAQRSADAGPRDPCEGLTAQQRTMVVARVGDSTLTLCDFAQRINLQNQYLRARFSAPEQRRALLRNWVDSELLAAEAHARGLDQDPNVEHSITSQLARQLENQIRSSVPQPDITDADVEAYFNQHRSEYDTPEQVRASQIVLPTQARAEQVLTEVRAHPNDDAFWRDEANRNSIDMLTRANGGELGFFTQQGGTTVAPEVAAAAFALHTPGEIAPQVIESQHGGPGGIHAFHVVRFTARRDALHRTLDEVRRPIRNRIWRERFEAAQQAAIQQLVQQLRAQAHVTIDENALAQVHVDLPPDAGVLPGITVVTPPNLGAAPSNRAAHPDGGR